MPAWTGWLALAVIMTLGSGLPGLPGAAVRAQEQPSEANIASGMRIYRQKADCQACHGWAGDGRKMDNQMPDGANLRESRLSREQLVFVVKCGLPGRSMPAFDRFAYRDDRCLGRTRRPPAAGPRSARPGRHAAAARDRAARRLPVREGHGARPDGPRRLHRLLGRGSRHLPHRISRLSPPGVCAVEQCRLRKARTARLGGSGAGRRGPRKRTPGVLGAAPSIPSPPGVCAVEQCRLRKAHTARLGGSGAGRRGPRKRTPGVRGAAPSISSPARRRTGSSSSPGCRTSPDAGAARLPAPRCTAAGRWRR